MGTLGSDFAGYEDIDADLTFLEGPEGERLAYLHCMAALILTPTGAIEWAPDAGLGIERYMSSAATAATIAQDLHTCVMYDERTQNATVDLISNPEDEGRVSFRVTCFTTEGAYPLTTTIDKVQGKASVSFDGATIERVL